MNATPAANPLPGTRGSGMILALFGAVWWWVGSVVLNGPARPAALAVGVLVALVLLVLAARRLDGTGEREAYERSSRTFAWCNAGQGIGIGVVIVAGNVTGHQNLIPAFIAVVVGVHFFPLARPFGHPEYRWTGGLLVLVGAVCSVVALAGAPVTGVLTAAGAGSALVLWSTTVWYLRRGAPAAPAQVGAATATAR
ncbi:hypothetical protein [Streptomyces bohaiensis]|uniref:hypothetical protein n=1 Tax=Streptomyces bohaiensis TaxID=1431344 RepID=UPI003B82AAB8